MDNATAAAALYGTPQSESSNAQAPDRGASVTSVLYGSEDAAPEAPAAAPGASSPQQDTASAPEDTATTLYGAPEVAELEIPDSIKAERAADPARRLYDPAATYGDTLNASTLFADQADAEQMTPAMQRAVVKELAHMAADVGMDNGDVRALQTVFRHVSEAPSEETRAQWREQAVKRLNEIYGMGAKQALADAAQYVQADPRRARLLSYNSAGDHPEAVLLSVRLARQARMQGKIK